MDGVINILTVAAAALLSVRLYFSGLHRRYRAFFLFLIFFALQSSAPAVLGQTTRLPEGLGPNPADRMVFLRLGSSGIVFVGLPRLSGLIYGGALVAHRSSFRSIAGFRFQSDHTLPLYAAGPFDGVLLRGRARRLLQPSRFSVHDLGFAHTVSDHAEPQHYHPQRGFLGLFFQQYGHFPIVKYARLCDGQHSRIWHPGRQPGSAGNLAGDVEYGRGTTTAQTTPRLDARSRGGNAQPIESSQLGVAAGYLVLSQPLLTR